jgi:hypothetical protein
MRPVALRRSFGRQAAKIRPTLPGVLIRNIEDFLDEPVRHAEKADGLLRVLAESTTGRGPFEDAPVSMKDLRRVKVAGWKEAREWFRVLAEDGLVQADALERWLASGQRTPDAPTVRLTPKGWSRAEELFGNVGSKTCFIAMSFSLANRSSVQAAIEAACAANGWTGTAVDSQEYTGAVMDRILAQINRARFVVADFTEHKEGVYYEAGYAEGRGIPVIYTVHRKDVKELHFDTRHLNHIVWEAPDDLQERLTARIGAVINR